MPLLDRAAPSQNQRIRRQSPGIPLPRQRLPGDRALENEGIKITVVGALAIAVVIVLLVLLTRFLGDQLAEHGTNPQK